MPPQFISQPQNITVTESTVALFECSAIGNPTPTITWKRVRAGRQESLLDQRPGGDLYITSMKRNSDEGTYYCTASNSAGIIVSNGAILKIMGKSIYMHITGSRCSKESKIYYILPKTSIVTTSVQCLQHQCVTLILLQV